MVLWTLEHALGSELLVPKIPSYRIMDVAEAIGPGCEKPIVGIRPGEKIHEEMITASDSFSCIDLGPYYAILPSDGSGHERYDSESRPYSSVDKGFAYNSGSNPDFLSVPQLRGLIKQYVDSSFEPLWSRVEATGAGGSSRPQFVVSAVCALGTTQLLTPLIPSATLLTKATSAKLLSLWRRQDARDRYLSSRGHRST